MWSADTASRRIAVPCPEPALRLQCPSRSLFQCPLARLWHDAAGQWLGWSAPRPDFETALQEILVNCAVHEILSQTADFETLADCSAYWETCQNRLVHTPLGDLPIQANVWQDSERLWLSCSPSSPPHGPVVPRHGRGRGLAIVRALSESLDWDENARHIFVSFRGQ